MLEVDEAEEVACGVPPEDGAVHLVVVAGVVSLPVAAHLVAHSAAVAARSAGEEVHREGEAEGSAGSAVTGGHGVFSYFLRATFNRRWSRPSSNEAGWITSWPVGIN